MFPVQLSEQVGRDVIVIVIVAFFLQLLLFPSLHFLIGMLLVIITFFENDAIHLENAASLEHLESQK